MDKKTAQEDLQATVDILVEENEGFRSALCHLGRMLDACEVREALLKRGAEQTREELRDLQDKWKNASKLNSELIREKARLQDDIQRLNIRLAAAEARLARQAGPTSAPGASALDAETIMALIKLVHPDRHGNSEASTKMTAILLEMREKMSARPSTPPPPSAGPSPYPGYTRSYYDPTEDPIWREFFHGGGPNDPRRGRY